ncbi:MFS general substrate transporter [Ganoderma sinense ZZ0214-1]|uniref:MFS general substrate transporter n=1 Tax=Ganoderma sinense ZZ0214-1 TaxID=1077348 RepID=A0A2G8RX95_9APHY|nr:MFS general substrate transporter [Ganoderma sinense ZZ0214-1]
MPKPSLSLEGTDGSILMEMSPEKGAPVDESTESEAIAGPQEYRLYKRRWIGLVALVILNIVSGMTLVWFGPIANAVVPELGFTLDQINWFGNIANVVYLPSAFVMPYLYRRLGVRKACFIAGSLFVVSAWVRFAGTVHGLSVQGSYALIMVGQLLAAMAMPILQVVVPSYSERWFNLKSRTTATMIMSLANPVGNALGQLISPLVSTTRDSILVMAIIFTAAAPIVFLVGEAPPTPPTFAATHKRPSLSSLGRAMLGKVPRSEYAYMTLRQRIDFVILCVLFGVLSGIINTFAILTAQQLAPYGYSDNTAGFMGAVLLLVGLVCGAISSLLLDHVFTNHLALTGKLLLPAMGASWLAMIWEIKPHNDVVLFVLAAIIGGTGLTLLPVVLELGVELTRNADGSSAILWFSTNLCGLIFVLVEGALRAGPNANPPYNMHRAIIFQGVLGMAVVVLVYLLEGKQTRRAQDEVRDEAARTHDQSTGPGVDVLEVPLSPSMEERDKPAPAEITRVDLESGKDSPVGMVVR